MTIEVSRVFGCLPVAPRLKFWVPSVPCCVSEKVPDLNPKPDEALPGVLVFYVVGGSVACLGLNSHLPLSTK